MLPDWILRDAPPILCDLPSNQLKILSVPYFFEGQLSSVDSRTRLDQSETQLI